jgi:hypothetical protein
MAERNGGDPSYVRLWRVIAIGVDTALIAFTAMADTLGRLYIRPDFHVSEVLFATLVGSWLVLLGFEGVDLIRHRRNGNNGH